MQHFVRMELPSSHEIFCAIPHGAIGLLRLGVEACAHEPEHFCPGAYTPSVASSLGTAISHFPAPHPPLAPWATQRFIGRLAGALLRSPMHSSLNKIVEEVKFKAESREQRRRMVGTNLGQRRDKFTLDRHE